MNESDLEAYYQSQARTVKEALPEGATLLHDGPLLVVSTPWDFAAVAQAAYALGRVRLRQAPLVQVLGDQVLLAAMSAKG